MYSGEAAEQVVRMSLEGVEVAAKVTGEGAKDIALILAAVLKEEHKTKGKARLSSMIKSGKELKVFTVQEKDLKKFTQEAKRYGVLFSILKDKENSHPTAAVDVIARAEDASKISRIMERFELASTNRGSVNPTAAKTDRGPLSERDSTSTDLNRNSAKKPSVREKLAAYRAKAGKSDKQQSRGPRRTTPRKSKEAR